MNEQQIRTDTVIDFLALMLAEGSADEREVCPEVIAVALAEEWIEVLDVGCYRQVLLTDLGKTVAEAAREAAVFAILHRSRWCTGRRAT